jgi:membrane protease YdiL (CAAX protease family)
MATALAVGGPVLVALNWLVVRSGRTSIWVANTLTMGILGVLSLLTGLPEATRGAGVPSAAVVGVGAGVALYLATVAFMAVAGRWPPLARQARSLYGNRGTIPVPVAVALSAFVVAPGEELLWRGVVLEVLHTDVAPILAAAALAWAGYLVANAASGSIPILLGASVSGAAWTLLAISGFGLVSAIACHAVWTSLMIVRPPIREGS